jgi:hypothetical protein
MKMTELNLTLGIVSEVIDTKIDFEAKVVPVSQAKVIEKSIKAGKIVKMNAVPRR